MLIYWYLFNYLHWKDINEKPSFQIIFRYVDIVGDKNIILIIIRWEKINEDIGHEKIINWIIESII